MDIQAVYVGAKVRERERDMMVEKVVGKKIQEREVRSSYSIFR